MPCSLLSSGQGQQRKPRGPRGPRAEYNAGSVSGQCAELGCGPPWQDSSVPSMSCGHSWEDHQEPEQGEGLGWL